MWIIWHPPRHDRPRLSLMRAAKVARIGFNALELLHSACAKIQRRGAIFLPRRVRAARHEQDAMARGKGRSAKNTVAVPNVPNVSNGASRRVPDLDDVVFSTAAGPNCHERIVIVDESQFVFVFLQH